MTEQLATVTNVIPLPKALRSKWKNAAVRIQASGDTIIVKRLSPISWDDLLPKLRRVGQQFTRKDLAEAIRTARRSR